jgi:proline iminopeptidase
VDISRSTKRLLGLGFALGLIHLVYCPAFGFVPQTSPSDTTKYWNLPAGSRIAYYYYRGEIPRKPFPIIYLHGGPGGFVTSEDISVFSKLADDGYDVYLYDQIGGGKSNRLNNIREYTLKRHLKDLEAIIDIIGASRVIFIGHSWGASLAPLYVAKHSDKVEKLIFSGPGGMIPKKYEDPFIPLPDSVKLKNRMTDKHFASEYLDPAAYKRFNKIRNYAAFGLKIASDNEIDSLLDCLMTNKAKK